MAPHHLLPQPPPLRPASNSSSIAAPDAEQDNGPVLPNLPGLPGGGLPVGGGLPPGADALAEQFKKFYSTSYYASLQAAAVAAAAANAANGGGAGAAGAATAASVALDPISAFADAEDGKLNVLLLITGLGARPSRQKQDDLQMFATDKMPPL